VYVHGVYVVEVLYLSNLCSLFLHNCPGCGYRLCPRVGNLSSDDVQSLKSDTVGSMNCVNLLPATLPLVSPSLR